MRPTIGSNTQVKEITFSTNQAQATYTLTTASGDVLVDWFAIYVDVAATSGGLMTVAIQTNDTTPFPLMTIVEGAVAALTLGKNVAPAATNTSFKIKSGKSLTATIATADGTAGSLKIVLVYRQITGGASLS
jgi:hypothetical protein